MNRIAAILALFALAPEPAFAQGPAPVVPPFECTAHVGYDRDLDLPGYLIALEGGAAECVPVTVTAARPPAGTAGDFYVDAFTDERLRARWAECQADPACAERIGQHIASRLPPNREHRIADPHVRDLLGKVDAESPALDLASIRRPAYFARAPYAEPIAAAEDHSFTVEFTVEPEPYERIEQHRTEPVKLRGWYLTGAGVEDGKGGRVRALVIMSNGGGGRIAAVEDPADRLYRIDPATGKSVLNRYPSETTGAAGQRTWRQFVHALNQGGFDVLSYDRRGVGLSGGYSDTNTLQQGRDILSVIQALDSGAGVRVLTPAGATLAGDAAVAALGSKGLPVLLGGNSRGTMAAGWAMARNFDTACDYDLTPVTCGPPLGLKSIKGAMMLADFTPGIGYLTAPTEQADRDRPLFTAGSEVEHHIVFFPSSAVFAGLGKWPALFIGRGLWDYAASLEGAMAAVHRVKGLTELDVVRAPHPIEVWPEEEQRRVAARMVAFGRAVVLGQAKVPGAPRWADMKELVATAGTEWEPSSRPKEP